MLFYENSPVGVTKANPREATTSGTSEGPIVGQAIGILSAQCHRQA